MSQGYEEYNYGDNSIANTQQTIRNMNVELVRLKDFSLSIVEFCNKRDYFSKHKDDDRKMVTQGPPRPPGITYLNNTNTYLRTVDSINTQPDEGVFVIFAEAFCDTGDFVIHRGFRVLPSIIPDAVALISEDNEVQQDSDQDIDEEQDRVGWNFTLTSTTAFQPFQLKIRCFDNP